MLRRRQSPHYQHHILLVVLLLVNSATFKFVHGAQSEWIDDDYDVSIQICRDKNGLDCDHNPLDVSRADLEELGYENDEEYFNDMCCSKGGGEFISSKHPVVRKLLNTTKIEGYHEYLIRQLSIQGSPQHRALFWLLVDDEFGIQHYSEWLMQRYALSVMFFSLGGAWRWRDCWYGERYTNRYNLSLDLSSIQRDECVDYNRDAWLSSTMECNWSFLKCDRNDFVTEIRMLANVMGENERDDDTIPYTQTTQDIVQIPIELMFLSERLISIDLRGNHISGTLPSELGGLHLLRTINLHANSITGSLPQEIFNISGLEEYNIGKNLINGTISTDIGKLRQLRKVHFGYNQVSGSIPTEIGLCGKLSYVYLSHNKLNGSVPWSLCSLKDGDNVFLEKVNVDCSLECSCCTSCASYTSAECNVEDSKYARTYGWILETDKIYDDPFNNPLSVNRGCEWVELMDDQGCPKYGGAPLILADAKDTLLYPSKECCHCGACSDDSTWSYLDKDCKWIEQNDMYGCPFHGSKANSNGVTAKQACCWCGGGKNFFETDPTAFPSLSLAPSPIPTLREGNCSDVPDWSDYNGFLCDDYLLMDEDGCPNIEDNSTVSLGSFLLYNGYEGFNGTISAHQACCHCGGGIDNTVPSSTPSISLLPTTSPTINSCHDYDGWMDMYGNSCEMFELLDTPGCPLYGQFNYSSSLVFATQACCHCGGGIDQTLPSLSPSIPSLSNSVSAKLQPGKTCDDISIPRPWPEFDCDWFSLDPKARCAEFGEMVFFSINDQNMTANSVCCSCGGGTSTCSDFPMWFDSHHTSYTCQQYHENEECEAYGKGYVNFGLSASDACCVCGGGYDITTSNMLLQEQSDDCFDDFNWVSSSGEFTCSSFQGENDTPDVQKCLSYGHVVSSNNINGSDACCNCRYGYDDLGGGYRGILRGKIVRVGFIENNNVDIMHTLDLSLDGAPNGAIYEFYRDFSESHGLGLMRTNEIDNESSLTADRCISDLTVNKIDICIGVLWKSESNPFLSSSPLFFDQFYLVVKKVDVPFYDTILGGFASFTWGSWMLILATVLLFGITVDFIYFGYTSTYFKDILCCRSYRLGELIYASMTLFLGKRPVTPAAKGTEKCAIFGFAIFTLFIVSTFTGSITASIVNTPKQVRFESLDEAIEAGATVCVSPFILGDFTSAYPASKSYLRSSLSMNSTILLSDLDEGNCDAIVISYSAFQSETRLRTSVCDDYVLLQDDVLLTLPVVLPLGRKLGVLGDELLSRINRMIDLGWFTHALNNNSKKVSRGCSKKYEANTSSSIAASQILMPALISILSSLIAVWFRFKQEKDVKETDSKTSYESEPLVPNAEITGPNTLVLFKFVSKYNTNSKQLAEAVEELPNKAKLVELVCAEHDRLRENLRQLTIVELLDVIMHCATVPLEHTIENRLNSALASDDRQAELIKIILSSLPMIEQALSYLADKSDIGSNKCEIVS